MKKLDLETFKSIARKKGGKCLSKKYTNGRTPLLWQCSLGHKWYAVPESIRGTKNRNGTWCGKCSNNNPGTLKKLIEFARVKRGRCLEKKYLGARIPHKWECELGHNWLSTPDNTLNKSRWCPECIKKKKYTIEQMQILAKERGGKCLSKRYVSNGTCLIWQCANLHKWSARPTSIMRGTWCPECALGIGERITRCYFEQIFKAKFPKYKRFDWLMNLSGNKMELDGYNAELKIAFEHQGAQHFKMVKPFTASLQKLNKRKKEDKLKRDLCYKHGIKLILVPEVNNLISLEELMPFLKRQFVKAEIAIPKDFDSMIIDLRKAYTKDHVSEMRALAKSRSGKFISIKYSGNLDPHIWECSNGHRFNTSPAAIKAGRWCRYCAGNIPKTIEELSEVIRLKGGKCLTASYKNAHTKIQVQCKKGHKWDAIPRLIFRGHWCPYCAGQKGTTIADFHALAEKRGGKCLSNLYENAHSKLSWRCGAGHRWVATANSVKRGSWCPKCSLSRRSSNKEKS